jgi:hypothetical protein
VEFLQANRTSVAAMSLTEFREWLQQRIQHAAGSELFRSRCRIRNLERQHRRRLQDRKRRLKSATADWQASPLFDEFQQLTGRQKSLQKAVAGLAQAVAEGRADADKLQQFEQQLQAVNDRLKEILTSSSEAKRVDSAEESWQKLRSEIGLTQAIEAAVEDASEVGTAASLSGDRFEVVSAAAVEQCLRPEFQKTLQRDPTAELMTLHGATLGCARGEFDHLLVVSRGDDVPVEVLAVVEAKRNINDLPHGFRLRQENLAWFVNDPQGFDSDQYRTAAFPNGTFDRPVVHRYKDRQLIFAPASFQRFATPAACGYRLQGLCFVTERRRLLGMTSAELSRLMHVAATDPRVTLDDQFQLTVSDTMLKRLRSEIFTDNRLQTYDVLDIYCDSDDLASQIIFA